MKGAHSRWRCFRAFDFKALIAFVIVASFFIFFYELMSLHHDPDAPEKVTLQTIHEDVKSLKTVASFILSEWFAQSQGSPDVPLLVGDGVLDEVAVITIVQDDQVFMLEELIGSLHRYTGSVTIVVYGLRLSNRHKHQIPMWDSVRLIDIEENFFASEQSLKETNDMDWSIWLPAVIEDALAYYPKVLFLHPHMLVIDDMTVLVQMIDGDRPFFVGGVPTADVPLSNWVQGYRRNGRAFKTIIKPLLNCFHSLCEGKTLTRFEGDSTVTELRNIHPFKLDALGLYYNDKERGEEFKRNRAKGLIPKTQSEPSLEQYTCHLRLRQNLVHSISRITGRKSSLLSLPRGGKTRIAIGIPVISKNKNAKWDSSIKKPNEQIESLGELRVFATFLPSLLRTIDSNSEFVYTVMLGFDEGDPLYDDPERQSEIVERFKSVVGSLHVALELIRFSYAHGWVTFIWNGLFEFAVDSGYDYFYQANDDLRFDTPGWTELFVSTLRANPLLPNLGVIGPVDKGNSRILTQSFTHRTHYDIFGYYFPTRFRNWYCDDWMSKVYLDSESVSFRSDVSVKNTNAHGTRYDLCTVSEVYLEEELRIGEKKILQYLAQNNPWSLRELQKKKLGEKSL